MIGSMGNDRLARVMNEVRECLRDERDGDAVLVPVGDLRILYAQASRTPVVADREARIVQIEDTLAQYGCLAAVPTEAIRALSAAPVVADVDAIARVLALHMATGGVASSIVCGCGLGIDSPHNFRRHQAEQVAALLRG